MIGSRNTPIFSTTAISRLTCASEGIALVRRRLDAGDRQRDEQQRTPAEGIVVPAEDRASFLVDLRREPSSSVPRHRLDLRRRQSDRRGRDLLPAHGFLLRHMLRRFRLRRKAL